MQIFYLCIIWIVYYLVDKFIIGNEIDSVIENMYIELWMVIQLSYCEIWFMRREF